MPPCLLTTNRAHLHVKRPWHGGPRGPGQNGGPWGWFVHLARVVWAGFVGAATGTQQSTLEIRMAGGRWHVGPAQGYASPRRILPEVPSTSERDHSPLRSRVWCPWPGGSPVSQGTEISGVRRDPDWVCAWFVPSMGGDSLHQDHCSPGLVPRSHPREHTGLELCQPLGNPLPQKVAASLHYSLGLHLLLAGDREPVG